jgi:hypothetical protein
MKTFLKWLPLGFMAMACVSFAWQAAMWHLRADEWKQECNEAYRQTKAALVLATDWREFYMKVKQERIDEARFKEQIFQMLQSETNFLTLEDLRRMEGR